MPVCVNYVFVMIFLFLNSIMVLFSFEKGQTLQVFDVM